MTITTTDFENFTSLEELYVTQQAHNNINNIIGNIHSSYRDFSNNNLVTIESGSFDNAIALTDLYVISLYTYNYRTSNFNNITGILLETVYQTSQMISLLIMPLTLCKMIMVHLVLVIR